MIGYITLGTNNLSAAAAFYDAVLGKLGATRSRSSAELVGWRFPAGGSELYVLKPYDGNTAVAGNGPMVGLHSANRTLVDAVYAKAIECGGLDEGRPGLRPYSAGFYAAYFRDLDGNKLNAFCFEGIRSESSPKDT